MKLRGRHSRSGAARISDTGLIFARFWWALAMWRNPTALHTTVGYHSLSELITAGQIALVMFLIGVLNCFCTTWVVPRWLNISAVLVSVFSWAFIGGEFFRSDPLSTGAGIYLALSVITMARLARRQR